MKRTVPQLASRWQRWPYWGSPAPWPLESRCLSKAAWKGLLPSLRSLRRLCVDVDATGNATQLGQFTLDIPHVVNRSNGTAIGSYRVHGGQRRHGVR